jgi:ribosome maturation protein Sdo1
MSYVNRHGAQGTLDGASKSTLENEFGTHIDDEVIKQILEKGNLQETEVRSMVLLSNTHTTLTNLSSSRAQRDQAPRTIAWAVVLATKCRCQLDINPCSHILQAEEQQGAFNDNGILQSWR